MKSLFWLLLNRLNQLCLWISRRRFKLVHVNFIPSSHIDVWRLLKQNGFNPNTIVDIGADRGHWTQEMLTIFPKSEFILIEPLHENKSDLEALAQRYKNVKFWLGALGRTSGTLEFHVHGQQSSMFDSQWGGKVRTVPLEKLDTLVFDHFKCHQIDVLKLDVQGAELEILSAASKVLAMCKVIQIEVSFRHFYVNAPLAHEIVAFFAAHGFRIFDIAGLWKRKDGALLQADMFFVNDDGLFAPETFTILPSPPNGGFSRKTNG